MLVLDDVFSSGKTLVSDERFIYPLSYGGSV